MGDDRVVFKSSLEREVRALIENIFTGIILTKADRTVIYASPSITQMFGYSAEELIGRPIAALLHPDDAEQISRLHTKVLQEPGKPVTGEFRARHKDGSWCWVETVATNFLADPGIQATVSTFRDVTQRRQAEESVRRRAADLEALHGIAQKLQQVHSLDDMYQTLVDRSMALFGAVHGSLALLGADHTTFTRVCTRGIATETAGSTFPVAGSRSGSVVQSNVSFVTGDFASEVQPAAWMKPDDYQMLGPFALVPLRSEKQILGTLVVARPRGADSPAFSEAEVRLLETIADTAGTAIRRARLYDETERRAAEFESLYETTRDLAAHPDVDALLQAIVERATSLLRAHGGLLAVYDARRNDLEYAVTKEAPEPRGTRVALGDGFVGRVASTREALRIDDYRSWEHRVPDAQDLPLGALLGVPLLYGGDLIGVLDVHETPDSPRRFTDADARLLALFAGHAAAALYSARLFSETEKRLRQVQALHEIDVAISSTFDLRVTLQIFLSKVTEELGVDAADVLLFRQAAQTLEQAASRGFRRLRAGPTYIPLGANLLSDVVLKQTPVVIENLAAATNFTRARVFKDEGFVTYVAVPLSAKGQLQGVLEVFNRQPLAVNEQWMDFLNVLAGQGAIAVENATLVTDLQQANTGLALAYDRTIEGWSRALDLRDKETEGHTLRVTEMAVGLAYALGMPESDITHLRRGGLLHDIGKMGIPDSILLKPGPLTDEEWIIMRRHPVYAYELLSPIEYLRPALDIPYCHHEKWDGTGYPRGLREEQIPFAARIFAVVDVWDALGSDRPYRPAWSEEKTRDYIRSQSRTHFDPRVTEAMLKQPPARP